MTKKRRGQGLSCENKFNNFFTKECKNCAKGEFSVEAMTKDLYKIQPGYNQWVKNSLNQGKKTTNERFLKFMKMDKTHHFLTPRYLCLKALLGKFRSRGPNCYQKPDNVVKHKIKK